MTTKNLGPVSRYLDPEGRSWDTIAFIRGRPVLDSEVNLLQDAQYLSRKQLGQAVMASGFITGRNKYGPLNANVDDTNNESRASDFVLNLASPVANELALVNHQMAWVAGYPIDLGDEVTVTLPVPSAIAGTTRVDLVWLEVWLALIDSTTTNKDGSGNIFNLGNVDSPVIDNYSDDLIDPLVTLETAKRVQIQWRIRTQANVDIFTYAAGLDDPTITAQANETIPTVFVFTNQADEGDPGLWVASGLTNTVDGNCYAIPIAAVARRNSAVWDKDINANGGSLIVSGTSTRPDGLFADQVAEKDLLDLRRTVTPHGFVHSELLEKNLSWLFDNKLRTNLQNNNLGGGQIGTSWTQADEIGPVDTPGATLIGAFNGVQILYSDAVQTTEYTFTVLLSSRTIAGSPTVWASGDQFVCTLPLGTPGLITHIEPLVQVNKGYRSAGFNVTGLNTTSTTFTLTAGFDSDIPVGARTSTDLYVRVRVSFQPTGGLSRYPTFYNEPIVTGTGFTTLQSGDNLVYESTPEVDFNGFTTRSGLYNPSRTAILEARYGNGGYHPGYPGSGEYTITSISATYIQMPWPVDEDVLNPAVFYATDVGKTTNLFVGASVNDDLIILSSSLGMNNANLMVDWFSKEPLRDNTAQVTLYYESVAFQTLNVPVSGMDVIQRHLDSAVYTTLGGSGSDVPSFPYIRPGAQIPVSNTTMTGGESAFRGFGSITLGDFGSSAQFLKMTDFIPFASIPIWRFQNKISDQDTGGGSAPARHAYTDVTVIPFSDENAGVPVAYQPAVFSQLLFTPGLHKTMYATIGSLREDIDAIGKRGELFLLVFTRTAADQQNSIILSQSVEADTCVAIYRLKGNPLIPNTERHG